MILYNVTVKIDPSVHDEWITWMKTTHIPEVLKTELFTEHKMCRILGQDEGDGVTYAIQYLSPDMNSFQKYQSQFAKALQAKHAYQFQNKYVAFRTLMEVIDS